MSVPLIAELVDGFIGVDAVEDARSLGEVVADAFEQDTARPQHAALQRVPLANPAATKASRGMVTWCLDVMVVRPGSRFLTSRTISNAPVAGGPVLHVQFRHGEIRDIRGGDRGADANCCCRDEAIGLMQRDALGRGLAAPKASALTF